MGANQPFDFQNSDLDQVTYRFTDSSVPPRYHRSYSIVVTAQAITVTVDSYGDIVAQQSLPSSATQLQAALAVLDEAAISPGRKDSNPRCTGGTSDRITGDRQGQTVFSAYRYNCGGESGPMQGDIAAVKAHFQGLIPDLAQFIRT